MNKNSSSISTLLFFNRFGFNFFVLIPSVVFALLSAFFEGISVGLLIPILNGIIKMDFHFVNQMPVLGQIVSWLPTFAFAPKLSIFIFLLAFTFTAALIKNVFQYLSCLLVSRQIRKLTNEMRKVIFARYLSFGKLFFDQINVGYLSNLLIGYTSQISNYIYAVANLLPRFFILIIYLIMMWIISWKLTIFAFLIFPVLHYSLRWLIARISASSDSHTATSNDLARRVLNILTCIPLVKTYTREKEEIIHFSGISNHLEKLEYSMDKKRTLIEPLQEIIMLASFLLLITFMTLIYLKGYVGTLAGYLIYFFIIRRAFITFGVLNEARASLAIIGGPIKEISSILDDRNKFFVTDGEKKFHGLSKQIEFKNLNFSYLNGAEILKNISFQIEKNKMTAIVGPSGSGKTTLINLILRFYDCPAGSLLFDNEDVRNFTLKSLREKIAWVSQDTLLFNDTLRANICYGMDKIANEELIEASKKARLYDFVTRLPDRFETFIGDKGLRLSGGEKQRVAIARAVLKNAEILVLDEATSALDTATEKLIQEAIEELTKDKTTIVIAHRLSTIKNADRIVVIENGQIAETGTLHELLEKRKLFYQYWQAQKFY